MFRRSASCATQLTSQVWELYGKSIGNMGDCVDANGVPAGIGAAFKDNCYLTIECQEVRRWSMDPDNDAFNAPPPLRGLQHCPQDYGMQFSCKQLTPLRKGANCLCATMATGMR